MIRFDVRCRAMSAVASMLYVLLAVAAVATVVSGFAGEAWAQKPDEKKSVDLPLVVVNVASVERLLSDVDYMFDVAGREELSDFVRASMANVRDLKGMDRGKSFGVMIFLGTGLVPQPVPVGFVPVKNFDDLVETVSAGPVTVEKVDNDENQYKIVGERTTFHALLKGDYAFVSQNDAVLDLKLANPATLTKQLSGRYDIAVSLNLTHVPEGIKTVFLDFLRARTEAELQQRDDESDGRFQLRKANAQSWLEVIELTAEHGENLTIGWNASNTSKDAVFDFNVDAKPDSKFAKYLKDIGGAGSYFANLLADDAPLTFSTSWKLDESGKKTLKELLNVAEGETTAALKKEPAIAKPVKDVFASLTATAEAGHVDFFAQFFGQPSKKFVLIGGLKVAGGGALRPATTDILRRLKENPEVAELELNIDLHRDVGFHRIRGKNVRSQDERIYGENPSLYLGVGPTALWFAVGGKDALSRIKLAIDKVTDKKQAVNAKQSVAPFQFILNMSSWLAMMQNNETPNPFADLAKQAFSKGDDTLRVDFRPTDNGARFRIRLEEGFIRLIGLSIARRIDGRQ